MIHDLADLHFQLLILLIQHYFILRSYSYFRLDQVGDSFVDRLLFELTMRLYSYFSTSIPI